MAKIAGKAAALDKALEALDERIGAVDKKSETFANNWQSRTKRMADQSRDDVMSIRKNLTGLNLHLNSMERKRTVRLDADTSRAERKIRYVHTLAQRTQTFNIGARGGAGGIPNFVGGAAGGGFAGGAAGRGARGGGGIDGMLGRLLGAADAIQGAVDRIGINLGPASSRLSTLPLLLGLMAPPVLAGISGAVTVLTGSIAALGAAAVGALGMVGALGVGLGAIAIPAYAAATALGDKRKEIDKNKKALERAEKALAATDQTTKASAVSTNAYNKAIGFVNRAREAGLTGTYKYNAAVAKISDYEAKNGKTSKAYTRALKRRDDALKAYNESLSKVTKNEQRLITNVDALKKAWKEEVMGGPAGDRALGMMSEGAAFATAQMPWVGQQFDKFTAKGEKLFRMANKNAPRFRKLLDMATDKWPERFEEGGMATGHLAEGLLGVARAAEPLTEWMSEAFLSKMERFNKWANSGTGQLRMLGFFKDMKPILSELSGLVKDFGDAFIDLSLRDADDTVFFLQQLRELIRALPEEIDFWTDKLRGAWPVIEDFTKDMYGLFKDVANFISDIKSGVIFIKNNAPDIMPGTMKGAKDKLPDIPDHWAGTGMLAAMAMLGTKGGRGLIAGGLSRIPGVGRAFGRGTKVGKRGLGGGLAGIVAEGVVPVYVTNEGWGKRIPEVVPTGTGRGPGTGTPINRGRGGGAPPTPNRAPLNTATGRPYPGTEPLGRGEFGRATPSGRIIYPSTAGPRPTGPRPMVGGMAGGAGAAALIGVMDQIGWNGLIPGLMGGNYVMSDEQRREKARREQEASALLRYKLGMDRDPYQGGSFLGGVFGGIRALSGDMNASTTSWRARYNAMPQGPGHGGPKDATGNQPAGQEFMRRFIGKRDIFDFMRADKGNKIITAVDRATRIAMKKGEANLRIGGVNMVISYNGEIDKIETRRIDLSGFFADMWAKFRTGVVQLGSIVTSVENPLEKFWDALTGGDGDAAEDPAQRAAGGGKPAATAKKRAFKKPGPREGDGLGGAISSLIDDPLGAVGGLISKGTDALVNRTTGWLDTKGTAGKRTSKGLKGMYQKLKDRVASMFDVSGGAGVGTSSSGLVPAAKKLMNFLASKFGVVLTSGFRPGAVTESGNISQHGLGQAIDVGGSANQMQAVWNFLLGKPGINEMIYAGQIAQNGGAPTPYGGSDQHYDHVHIGLGDSRRGSGISASSTPAQAGGSSQVTLSMAGATIHIHTEADYETFVARLADDLDRAVGSSGGASAGGMIDA